MPDKKERKQSIGLNMVSLIILAILVGLLTAEFLSAQFTAPRWLLLVFAVGQAGIILWEYMHVRRVVGGDEE